MAAPAWTGPPSNVSSKSSPWIVAGGDDALHIIFVARSDGEPDPIDQELLAFAPHRLRQLRRVERGDVLRQRLGDGDFGEGGGGHGCAVLMYPGRDAAR
jgi:hypothetical protein